VSAPDSTPKPLPMAASSPSSSPSPSPSATAAADELAHYLEHHHGLSITRSPSKGRCLVALRSFRRGGQIFQQEPYVATLDGASQGSRCDRCYRPPDSCPLKRCSACKTVFYCSADCQVPIASTFLLSSPLHIALHTPTSHYAFAILLPQRSEWRHHKFECAILVRLLKEKQRTPTATMRLVLRLLIKRKLQADKVSMSVFCLHAFSLHVSSYFSSL
jgi:SET and MYND domain-containing protein